MHSAALRESLPESEFDLCIAKVDNLAMLNHQYGRSEVDALLSTIGRRLKTRAGADNCIAYIGNGIYVSCLVAKSREQRRKEIDDCAALLREESAIPNFVLKWSFYNQFPKELSVEEAFNRAQYALSIIRLDSDDDYIEFDQTVIERMEWEHFVRESFDAALEAGEFVPWYQPKFSTRTKAIVGAEALVRWVRPDGELIPPDRFVPILEGCGWISRLDRCIFRQVCALQKELLERELPVMPISVNLSRASIYSPELPADYERIAREYGVDPRSVPLEITESTAVRLIDLQRFAQDLLSRGFILHLDDFGTGFSSLSSLQLLPFNAIKLDKSLIDFVGMESGESMLRHIISFARESGKSVIAEGVENGEQFVFLKAYGCDAIQGYYFSRPLDRAHFLAMLSSQPVA